MTKGLTHQTIQYHPYLLVFRARRVLFFFIFSGHRHPPGDEHPMTRSTKYYRENGRGDCMNKVISMRVKSRHRRPNGIADPSNENGYTLSLKIGPLESIIGRR